MGLFSFGKKGKEEKPSGKQFPPQDSAAAEDLERARSLFAQGEYRETLRAIGSGFEKDVNYRALYELASETLEKLGGDGEKQLFTAVLQAPASSAAYKDLGNFYFSNVHYNLATVFYEKTLELSPDDQEVRHDLALCYARRFQVQRAVNLLELSGSDDFWDVYFLNKCKVLTGETEGVQEVLDELREMLDAQPDQEQMIFPKSKVNEVHEMLRRYHTVDDPRMHIRDWHYIQYGGVLLDYFDDSENYVAGGRYVASWGSFESVKAAAVRLRRFMETLTVPVRSVVAMPDRDSEIVGRVIAQQLGTDLSIYDPQYSYTDCLIVAAQNSAFNGHQELTTVRNGQLLYALHLDWLEAAHICPDIAEFMAQAYYFPWNGGGFKVIDAESGKFERTEPDTRPAIEIAAEISALQQEETGMEDLLRFYAERRSLLKGIGTEAGEQRYNFMIESPVPGSYFG